MDCKDSNYTKDEMLSICRGMLNDIDKCITDLVKSRLNNDVTMERGVLIDMEKLICGIQQDLTVVVDYIESK